MKKLILGALLLLSTVSFGQISINYDNQTDDNNSPIRVDSVDLMIQFTAGIDENHTYTNCQIFPNPANDVINLKCDDEIETICVYNLVGDKINEQTFGNSVGVSEILTGFYIVVLKTKNNKICRRVFMKK